MKHGDPQSHAVQTRSTPDEPGISPGQHEDPHVTNPYQPPVTPTAKPSLWMLATSRTSLAIIDQSVVSGTRFLTTIFIGRLCGQEELGVYSLTFAFYLIFACTQEALITTPYTVFGNRLHGLPRKQLAGSVLIHSLILSLAAAVALGGGTLLLWSGFGEAELMPATLALAVVIPFMLLWEFARRYAIAHLNLEKALALDVTTAIMQVSCIAWLAWQSRLSAVAGYLALGIGCACAGFAWFVLTRREFRFERSEVGSDWKENWRFGKWVLAGQIIGTLHGYTPAWVLALAIGTAATGVFSACQNIVLLSNPLILAITNLVAATTARAYAEGGYHAVRKIVHYTSLYSSAAMGVLWIFLVFAGGPAVVLLYGKAFSGNGHLVSAIAVAAPLWAMSCVISVGLRAIGRPDTEFRARGVGLLVTIGASLPMVSLWGIPGVAYALFVGSAASTIWMAWAFYRKEAESDRSLAVE